MHDCDCDSSCADQDKPNPSMNTITKQLPDYVTASGHLKTLHRQTSSQQQHQHHHPSLKFIHSPTKQHTHHASLPITTIAFHNYNSSRISISSAIRHNDRLTSLLACYATWTVELFLPRADAVAVGGVAGVVVVGDGGEVGRLRREIMWSCGRTPQIVPSCSRAARDGEYRLTHYECFNAVSR